MGVALAPPTQNAWLTGGPLARFLAAQTQENLRVYETSPTRVDEDAGLELNIAYGGYGKRQLLELIQNGADAQIDSAGGLIEVVLTDGHLYCANEGEAIDEEGILSLLHAHISKKRGDEIGRFGLGFKSVLGISRSPEFYSRSVSFRFDEEFANRRIAEVAPNRKRYPLLRVAQILGAELNAENDPVLRELMDWATTVVRLPRNSGRSSWLSTDIEDFDREFMLFSPHVSRLRLRDLSRGFQREISVDREGDDVVIVEGNSTSRWRIFKNIVKPSAEAKQEAWELRGRDRLPVVWAVPTEGRVGTGRFWAFFPLRDETTLTGIANAPWKVNDDRTGLLEYSVLNRELIDSLSQLVVSSVPDLVKPEDPGWILDVIPARGREARCWGDDLLTKTTYKKAASNPVVPDHSGSLRNVVELNLQPGGLPQEAYELWACAPTIPRNWCHPTVNSNKDRRSRAVRLFESAQSSPSDIHTWLEVLVKADPTPAQSAHAVTVAGLVKDELKQELRSGVVKRAKILMDSEGNLRCPITDDIFLPWPEPCPTSLLRLVHPTIADNQEARAAMEALGVPMATPELELKNFLQLGHDAVGFYGYDWDVLWQLVRRIEDKSITCDILRAASRDGIEIHVRVMAGGYRHLSACLLPGPIVPADGSRDADIAIDEKHHHNDLEILRQVGAVSKPAFGYPTETEPLVAAYRAICTADYLADLPPGSSRPRPDLLNFRERQTLGPLTPIEELSVEGKSAFTLALIEAMDDWRDWTLTHTSQRTYPPRKFAHPVVWLIRKEGVLPTSLGPMPARKCIGPSLVSWSSFAPVADIDAGVSRHLGLPGDGGDLEPRDWERLSELVFLETDDDAIGSFYEAAVRYTDEPPSRVRCRVGRNHETRKTEEVVAAHRDETFNALVQVEVPAVRVTTSDSVRLLVAKWGLRSAEGFVRHEPIWVEAGPAVPLVDAFPVLREDFEHAGIEDHEFVPCAEIRWNTSTDMGTTSENRDFLIWRGKVLWTENIGIEGAIKRIDKEFDLDLSPESIDYLTTERWLEERRERLSDIRKQGDDASRLLKALGEKTLRSRLPAGVLEAVTAEYGAPSAHELAQLVLVVHGFATLQHLKPDLEAAGLNPPTRWAGSLAARRFVRDLGFDDAFAGTPGTKRDPILQVPGPSQLPPLHDYQKEMVGAIRNLLRKDESDPRGLLSLPTGAGKTRVAVQALIEAMKDGDVRSPVLWLAQTDELCEQAVESWREVWRAEGSSEDLTLSRLWGPNEIEEFGDNPQIVVATPDKLRARLDDGSYDWLSLAACVVVDEAHGATTKEYTRVLEWQGIVTRGATTKTRCPLIGLTATPFRGTSVEETKRLALRFGTRRLDFGMGDEPYRTLQDRGILARVEGEVLGGADIVLTQDELAEFRNLRNMPKGVFKRIATDVDRNRRLLESIIAKPNDWSILLFAVSTEHAHTMAALLSLEGIRAASIDHTTDPGLRRRYVEEFRNGCIRVLANYGVLAQGFDAPAVRAIYVSRPTFSPNVYQQMIGRGLRGPLNGGKELCLIVNVADNWSMYGDQLAFREFEYLWNPDID